MQNTYIYIIRYIKSLSQLSVLAALTLSFAACSDDSDSPQVAKEATLHLRTSTEDFGSSPLLRTVPTGYSAYTDDGSNSDIAIYMTQGSNVIQTSTFKWTSDNRWTSKVAITPNSRYYVYGYMPADAATATISPYNASYVNGSTIVLTNLNTVTTKDVCVITGAASESTLAKFNEGIVNTTTPVTAGSFYIDVTENDNYIYLLMNHLYAKLSLNFKVEGPPSNYYNLRGIKLKKVQMVTGITGVTINIQSGSGTPQTTYNESAPPTTQTITIFDVKNDDDISNDSGIEITPTGIVVPAFFTPMPLGATRDITFISTYDVYYRNTNGTLDDNNIVRPNCTATNEWVLRAQDGAFGAGKQISISATIAPTYLYQLTDPDLDNPTIKLQ